MSAREYLAHRVTALMVRIDGAPKGQAAKDSAAMLSKGVIENSRGLLGLLIKGN